MAGIYIHIPFCRKICYYCDFYKSRSLSRKRDFLKALLKEITLRKNYLLDEQIETVYFGGGTPSVLSAVEAGILLDTLAGKFSFSAATEITFECNPEDLTESYLTDLGKAGINRLSIGCQSFYDKHLQMMNRRHDAKKAKESVLLAEKTGFENISMDLIYGLPEMTPGEWENNLSVALSLPVQHLSAYILTIEEKTVFYKWQQKGKINLPKDGDVINQYNLLVEKTKAEGMVHYEISNFGRENYFSRHNLLYWQGKKYLGLGPAAHSYDRVSRQWNVADLDKYIDGIRNGEPCFEKEMPDKKMQFDEYILTTMRTMWGADIYWLKTHFPSGITQSFEETMKKWIQSGHVREQDGHFILTDEGILLSDRILSECMAD
ncbi:MAG: radical SAM family heme chaperone HemW [Bacteroidales bacterium]|nr:radical SAM family heme chaperone HemW [Bacteroidales bacterium]